MRHNHRRCVRLRYLLSLMLLAATSAKALPKEAASLLKRHAGFNDDQISAVDRGERVVRILETGSPAEVAFAGVTRLPISLTKYLDRLRAGTLYQTGDNILQIGRFAENPSLADLKNLRFESYDLHPRGSSAEAAARAIELNKQILIDSIAEYERNGAMGVGPLGEQPKSIDVATQFIPMVEKSGYLRERLPAAYEYLLRYPHAPKRGSDDFFLWKQMTFGFRPITRVAQVALWEEERAQRREAIVITKQIYADRYFQASFQVDHLIADNTDPGHPSVFLISLNRGRSEFLEGALGKVIRPVVLSRTRAAAEKTLDQARSDLESEQRHAAQ